MGRARVASPHRRLVVLLVVMALALSAVIVRLVEVQAISGRRYASLGYEQRVRTVKLPAERGSIFDRNGNDLAISVPQQTVYADPRVVRDAPAAAARLAPVLGIDASTLERRLTQPDTAFVYLARKVDDGVADRVKALGIPGVGFVAESKRFYPGGNLAAPLLGLAGLDNNGLSGLEHRYDSTLTGKPGEIVAENDPSGREIPATERRDTPSERGNDLVLTVDQSMQYETEQRLVDEVQATRAKGGMAIVADVQTGDVLAMATVDGPDASHPARPASATEQNRPLTTVYEPGSTNKVITVASAMELGLVTPSTVLTVPDSLRIADATFADHDPHGTVQWTVADIMRESSNVGAIEIGHMVGKNRLDAYLRSFGFGSQTAIRFPGESAGLLLDPAKYTATSMGSVPVGNGLAVTAMQMLDVFVTIANDGVSRPPRLVRATIDADGTRHPIAAAPGRRVVSERTAKLMRVMLAGVVASGTGTKAAIAGYPVAGKTGTARKPPYEHPPYRYMASFAGFAPADHPRLAAIVVLDEPGSAIYGGEVAAPVFSAIMRYALRLEHVPPTGPLDGPLPRVRGETASNDVPALVAQGPAGPNRSRASGNVTGTSSPSG